MFLILVSIVVVIAAFYFWRNKSPELWEEELSDEAKSFLKNRGYETVDAFVLSEGYRKVPDFLSEEFWTRMYIHSDGKIDTFNKWVETYSIEKEYILNRHEWGMF